VLSFGLILIESSPMQVTVVFPKLFGWGRYFNLLVLFALLSITCAAFWFAVLILLEDRAKFHPGHAAFQHSVIYDTFLAMTQFLASNLLIRLILQQLCHTKMGGLTDGETNSVPAISFLIGLG